MAKRSADGFTDEERAAMKARAQELRAEARAQSTRADGERAVCEVIDQMSGLDGVFAGRFHALVAAHAPALVPRLWYGMPAYAENGKVVCFFQSADKFKTRYATVGFSDVARLDAGTLWPTAFALMLWDEDVEQALGALVARAVAAP